MGRPASGFETLVKTAVKTAPNRTLVLSIRQFSEVLLYVGAIARVANKPH
jgi:hypothetical protein